MATERDDDVSRRYRSLAREEPAAAIDAAILAASRRAVGSRPGGIKRWGPPLSIAAMLVLASGVVLRMQSERPGVETATPVEKRNTESAIPQAPAPVPSPVTGPSDRLEARDRAKVAPQPALPASTAEAPKAEAPEAKNAAPLRQEPRRAPEKKVVPNPAPSFAPVPAPESAPAPEPAPFPAERRATQMAPIPAPTQQSNLQAAPAASPARPAAAAGAASDSAARRDVQGAPTRAKSMAPPSPEAALEAIARLREEHRDDEADRALESFRRQFPDYPIPEAQWARVKPRER